MLSRFVFAKLEPTCARAVFKTNRTASPSRHISPCTPWVPSHDERMSMISGKCAECDEWQDNCSVGSNGKYYCPGCWEYEELRNTRCFSFAAIYDAENNLLSTAGSQIGTRCAERGAMWKLDIHNTSPKTLIVARIRRNRKRGFTFGTSKPCQQCIYAMMFYNIERVCYSQSNTTFEWANVLQLSNT